MSEENKKNVFDNLPKEDLIKKCQALIVIAQKAKKSKEKLEEENNELKKKISEDVGYDAIKEILDEKLILTTQLGNIELKNIALEDKLKFYEKECEYNQEKLDISEAENISSKRQLKKLTDENEHLITKLSDLEGQINQLNNLIKLQQEQLLQWRETKGSSIKDLQNKEFKSFKEVETLEICSQTIEIGINNVTEELRSVNMIPTRPVRGTNQNIDIHVSEISELKKNEPFSREVLCLQILNEKLKQKVKFYHSKLKMFALTIKEIKKEKNQVLQIFKAYTEQIVDWKKQLFSANKELLKLGSDIENKNSSLKNQKREFIFGNNLVDFEQVNIENITKVDCDHFFQKITDKHNFETYSFKDKLLVYKKNLDILKRNLIISKKDSEVDAFHKEKVEDIETLDLTTSRVDALEVKQNYIEGNINSKNKLVTNKVKINELIEEFMPEETALKQEIESLTENNRELLDNNYKIKQKLELNNRSYKNCFTQTKNCLTITQDNINLKYENSKLLQDMNQMNKALKQCEEIISQPDAHCNKLERRLHLSETNSTNGNVNDLIEKTEADKQIESLKVKQGYKEKKQLSDADSNIVAYFKTEADILTEKYIECAESNYAKSDTMPFSTISKYEVNRMKDLDGSWEERYIKLRAFAFKLKGKLQEQGINIMQLQTEKEELQIKLTNTSKTVHCLQNQIDKLQDNLDKVCIENKLYSSKLNSLAENISKDKQSLVEHEDSSIQLKKNDILGEKQGIENWKKQLSAKVKILRKELESKNLLIKEYESKISKLKTDSMNNDKEFKKNLSLGMQDYEKSIEGLYKIIETKNDVTNLETQSGMQKSALHAITYHNNLYEESKQTEKNNQNVALVELTALKKNISDLEEIVHHKDAKILGLLTQIETTKSQNDELSAELLRVISEHKKSLNLIISERDRERNQILCLQHSLRHTQDVLKLKEEELLVLKKEYETHRVRAQSVLEKKLGDHGLKEKLLEELFTLKSRDNQLNNDINELR